MCFFDKFKVSSTLWKLCIVFWLLLGITKIITWDIPESVGRSLILRFQAICEDYFLKFNNLGKHIAHSRLKMGGKYNSNVVYQWLQSFFSVPFSLDPPWMGPKFWVLSRPVLFFGSHLPWAPLKCTFFFTDFSHFKALRPLSIVVSAGKGAYLSFDRVRIRIVESQQHSVCFHGCMPDASMVALLYFRTSLQVKCDFWTYIFCVVLVAQARLAPVAGIRWVTSTMQKN